MKSYYSKKNTGNVYRITDGNVSNIVIHLNVSIEDERGLLGIAISKNDKSKQDNPFVFLYFTSCSQVKTDLVFLLTVGIIYTDINLMLTRMYL